MERASIKQVSAASHASTRTQGIAIRTAIFVAWLAVVAFLAWHHAHWRDEVRALSIARQGDNWADMLLALRGEGHPPLWYLLLRAAHDLTGSDLALPGLAMVIAVATALLLLFASPFPAWFAGLILATGPFLFQYPVVARNYGLTALLLFILASRYDRWRRSGVGLGILAVLLVNTNAHSVLLAAGVMLFWLLDIIRENGFRWRRPFGVWLVNALIAAVGVAICAWSLFPPYNDVVGANQPPATLRALVFSVFIPGWSMAELLIYEPVLLFGLGPISSYPTSNLYLVTSLFMLGALIGLVRWWPGVVAAGLTLVSFCVFFILVYVGGSRHQALWFLFLLSTYWIMEQRARAAAPAAPRVFRSATIIGVASLSILLVMQIPAGAWHVLRTVRGVAFSHVAELADLLHSRTDLRSAIMLPEPDFLLEALPYYASNPIYLAHEERFGAFSRFSSHNTTTLSLEDLLGDARDLCLRFDRTVVIALATDVEVEAMPLEKKEGYAFVLTATAADVAALKQSTEFLGRSGPTVSGESFGLYALHPPCRGP